MKKSIAVVMASFFMMAGFQAFGQQDQHPQQQTKEKPDKTKNEVVMKNNRNQGMGSRDTLNSKNINSSEKTTVKSNTAKPHDASKKKTTKKVKKQSSNS